MQVARNSKQIALIRLEPPGARFERLRQRFLTLSERVVFPDSDSRPIGRIGHRPSGAMNIAA